MHINRSEAITKDQDDNNTDKDEYQSVNQYSPATGLHGSELNKPFFSRNLDNQTRLQQHKQHPRYQKRHPKPFSISIFICTLRI